MCANIKRMRKLSVPASLARDLRLMKGLSQAEAADRFGVSAALVSAIENGLRPPEVLGQYILAVAAAPNKAHRTPGGSARVGRRKQRED